MRVLVGNSVYEDATVTVNDVEALEHIAVHDEHGQECRRPPDCAADALIRLRGQ